MRTGLYLVGQQLCQYEALLWRIDVLAQRVADAKAEAQALEARASWLTLPYRVGARQPSGDLAWPPPLVVVERSLGDRALTR